MVLPKKKNIMNLSMQLIDSGVETNSLGDERWMNAENMSLDDIVGRVMNGKHSQSMTSIEFNGEVVVNSRGGSSLSGNSKRPERPKDRKKRPAFSSSCGDLTKLKAERDSALKKVDQLTTELHDAQRERSIFEASHRKSEKNRLRILQNQMKGVLNERDEAIAKSEILEQELHRERWHTRLIGSDIVDTRRKKLSSALEEFKINMNEKEKTQQELAYDELYNRMNRVVDEKNQLSLQLQQTLTMSSEDKKRADKLERLLVALRRRKER